jgi:hypothetical protein
MRLKTCVCLVALASLAGCSSADGGERRSDARALVGVLLDKRDFAPEAMTLAAAGQSEAEQRAAHEREPEWLAQASVTDVPFAMSRRGFRWQTDARRVRWLITEDRLIARATSGADEAERTVAAFAITEHVAFREGLRPDADGAPTAVATESPLPWRARIGMRVDLSRNLADRVPLVADDPHTPVPMQPSPAQSTSAERRFSWGPDGITTVGFRTDTQSTLDLQAPRAGSVGFGDESLCALAAQRPWECAPLSASIRWVFSKANRESMVPVERSDRGFEESTFVRVAPDSAGDGFAVAPQLFLEPWARDGRGQRVPWSGDERAHAFGERDASGPRQYVTIPFRHRIIKPIALYVLGPRPEELAPIELAARGWSESIARSLREARRRECMLEARDDRERDACEPLAVAPPSGSDRVEQPLRLCHSPVWGDDANVQGFHSQSELAAARAKGWDSDACGRQGTTAAIGDGVHNVLAMIDGERDRSGPSALFGATVDRETHELSAAQILVSRAEIESAAHARTAMLRAQHGTVTSGDFGFNESYRDVQPDLPAPNLHSSAADLRDDSFEAQLLTREQRSIAERSASANALSDEARAYTSPLRSYNVAHFDADRRARAARHAAQCELSLNDSAWGGQLLGWLGDVVENRPPRSVDFGRAWRFTGSEGSIDWAQVYAWVQLAAEWHAVAHGIGHALGIEHNLAGSADVTNYPIGWWTARATSPMRPRHTIADGQSRDELHARDLAESTVMDLDPAIAPTLGRSDHAMIARTFTGLIDAFEVVTDQRRALSLFEHLNVDSLTLLDGDLAQPVFLEHHFTQLPSVLPSTSARSRFGEAVSVPQLGDDNRFWVFAKETTHVAFNSLVWEPIAPNAATRDARGQASTLLLVPRRVLRDPALGLRWDALAHVGAPEPIEVLTDAFRGVWRAHRYDALATGAAANARSDYVRELRRIEFEPVRAVSAELRRLRAAQLAYAHAPTFDAWLASPAASARRFAAAESVARMLEQVIAPEGSRIDRAYALAARPEDGAVYYRRAVFGDRAAFELPLGVGLGPIESAMTSPSDGVAAVAHAGSHHARVLAAMFLADVGQDRGPAATPPLAPMLDESLEGALRALGAIVSEDWEDLGVVHRRSATRELVFERRSLASLDAPRSGAEHSVAPALPLALRQWIALAWIRGAGADERRLVEWSRVHRSTDPDAPAESERVSFRDPLSGVTWVARHVDGAALSPESDPGASPVDVRRARAQCPTSEPECDVWARVHAERGIAARLLLRARSLAEYLPRAASTAERDRVTRSLREALAMIETLRTLAPAR